MASCNCTISREVIGATAWYRIVGKFENACAWDLSRRIAQEPLGEMALDFSQVGDFVDYGIAVLASAMLELPEKTIRLQGLRQHQLRLFKYFGVEPAHLEYSEDAGILEDLSLPPPLPAHGLV
jgi:hypothetical protein